MGHPKLKRGLYAITDNHLSGSGKLLYAVEAALQGGAVIVQYRDKSDNPLKRFEEAKSLLTLCQRYQVPLIINDDVELASNIGADGVHIGREDGSIQSARSVLGTDAIIGVSCYNQLELAINAAAEGADYIAFGAFFSSTIKQQAARAQVNLLTEAKRLIDRPVVAIGGITPENGSTLVRAGADQLAVITALFNNDHIKTQAEHFTQIYNE